MISFAVLASAKKWNRCHSVHPCLDLRKRTEIEDVTKTSIQLSKFHVTSKICQSQCLTCYMSTFAQPTILHDLYRVCNDSHSLLLMSRWEFNVFAEIGRSQAKRGFTSVAMVPMQILIDDAPLL